MCDVGPVDPLSVGLWGDSSVRATLVISARCGGRGFECECVVGHLELRACACLDLAGSAGDVRFGLRPVVGAVFFTNVRENVLDLFDVGTFGAAKRLEPIARKRLLHPNLANMGTRAIHSFSWSGAMVGLVVALCGVVVRVGTLEP